MKFKLSFEIEFDYDKIIVNDDSIGFYSLYGELENNGIISDAMKANIDPVERSMLKINYPEYYELLYREQQMKDFLSRS